MNEHKHDWKPGRRVRRHPLAARVSTSARETLIVPILAAGLMAALLALGGAGPATAAFPGANGKVAFESHRDGNAEVYVMNADGSGQTNLSNNAAGDAEPAWSPDGQKLAFASFRDGNYEIYVMNADGSGQTNLSNNAAGDLLPAWSPDGQKLAFTSSRDGNDEIYVMNADGSGPTRLTNNAEFDLTPAWSPDGQKLAFASFRDGNYEIYVMNADGSGQANLSNNAAADFAPAWSPDGQKLAFDSDRDGNLEVYVMNADGSGQANLTNNAAFDMEPDWQPLPDSDGDGIPDARDVEEIQAAVGALPVTAFLPPGGGTRNAIVSILDDVEAKIAAGEIDEAIALLTDLRRHLDGCGTRPDRNDWIIDCSAQVAVRTLVDELIAELST